MKIALVTTVPTFIENKRIEEEVKALGHEFELVDMRNFGYHISGNIIQVEKLSELEADIVIVRGVLKSIKPMSAYLTSMRKRGMKIFDNSFMTHLSSIDKVSDILKLAVNDVPVPQTMYAKDFQEYYDMADKIGYPVVVKSTRMGKGASVFKIDTKEALTELITDAEENGKGPKSYLMQEFIPYEHDLRVLVIGDNLFAMKRIPAEGEFRANFSLGGKVELFDLDEPGKALALKALKAIDMTVGGVDVLITKDNRRYILEVNHTAGFVGMEEATGENIGKLFVEHAIANAK